MLPALAPWLPSAGVVRMAALGTGVVGIGESVQALGVAFAVVALFAALGALAVERSDL